MGKNGHNVVGLDIGTSKVCCIVGELLPEGGMQIVGLGRAESRGLRKGVVVNMDTTVEAIKAAVLEAEHMAGITVNEATIGIAGGHIRSFNSRGVIAVGGRERVVGQDDIDRVMAAARAVSIPQDREILHVLPQEFVLDDQGGIHNPIGLVGSRLEANVHVITAASTSIQNLVSCTNRAGIEVKDTVLQQLAIAEAALSEDERELGVAIIDIGGGTTDLAIFERGSIWHTAVLPVGGDHFTNDLAVGLRTPIPDAEKLKIKFGCALRGLVEHQEAIEVPTVGGRKPRLLSYQILADILQPRAEELFTLFRDEIQRAGFDRTLNAGIVLTGGGCLLQGMTEIAEQIFDMPVRLGQPVGVEAFIEPDAGPQYATAIGMGCWSAKHHSTASKRGILIRVPNGVLSQVGSRVKDWFSEMF